ncbi:MAG: outer membrane lipoprotein carrier protein LolA [Chlorobi bacterium]|nr:outer membrane lipoprotein carrier protein LolA [Chlorobiota bacterium]
MKKLVIVLALLSAIPMFGQSNKEAEKLVKEVINKLSSYDNFMADLSYTMINNEMNINEKKIGKIFVSGDKYRVEMDGQIIISDGESIWTYLVDSEEVMMSNAADSEDDLSPTKILTTYDDNYKSSFDNDKKYKNSNIKKIDLKANEDKGFQQLSLVINDKDLSLESFSIYDMNGSVFTYHIIDLKPNLELPADTFTFDRSKYPDVELIDMR